MWGAGDIMPWIRLDLSAVASLTRKRLTGPGIYAGCHGMAGSGNHFFSCCE